MGSEHAVGLRELRQNTRAVLARVRNGETLDVTDYGIPVARLVPIDERPNTALLSHLIESGRLEPATRPGYRPRMRRGDGSDALADSLRALRDDERQ